MDCFSNAGITWHHLGNTVHPALQCVLVESIPFSPSSSQTAQLLKRWAPRTTGETGEGFQHLGFHELTGLPNLRRPGNRRQVTQRLGPAMPSSFGRGGERIRRQSGTSSELHPKWSKNAPANRSGLLRSSEMVQNTQIPSAYSKIIEFSKRETWGLRSRVSTKGRPVKT